MEESELPDCYEGEEAFQRFDATMSALLAVPKKTIVRRQKAYRKKVDANPNRRGPKRKSEQPGPSHLTTRTARRRAPSVPCT
jgi:hypothetical protein